MWDFLRPLPTALVGRRSAGSFIMGRKLTSLPNRRLRQSEHGCSGPCIELITYSIDCTPVFCHLYSKVLQAEVDCYDGFRST